MKIRGEKKEKGYEFIVKPGPDGSLNIVALNKPIEELEAVPLQAAINNVFLP